MKNFKLLVFLLLIVILSFGCQSKVTEKKKEPSNKTNNQSETGSGKKVFMLGRSVMNGWFRHWNPEDPYQPVKKNGYTLYYKEISGPPDIVTSTEEKLAEADNNTIIFFKFCFVDFVGGSGQEIQSNLSDNQKYVEQVYEAVNNKGLKLIIGNALPQVDNVTDNFMVDNHDQFNEWLEGFASSHENVKIFDQYGILADDQGNLRAEYATNPDDSHPNEAGYKEMDAPFFELLDEMQ